MEKILPQQEKNGASLTIVRHTTFWTLFLVLGTGCSLLAQDKNQQKRPGTCRTFVQTFYDWYVPKALKENDGPASNLALKYRASTFSPSLLGALRKDSEAQAKGAGEIVGLDFDPFLSGQDPGERYVLGKTNQESDKCIVQIYGVFGGKKNEKAVVVVELALRNGQWRFTNFRYPGYSDQDLLSILRKLQVARDKRPH